MDVISFYLCYQQYSHTHFFQDLQIISSADIYIFAIIWNRQNIKILQIKYRQVTILILHFCFIYFYLLHQLMKFAELDMSHTKYNSRIVQRNSVIFSILMILTQIGFSIIYGILYKIPSMAINISSVIVTITLAILVVGGFGLVLSYLKRLLWSGIGFTFFITAFCIEMYPLVNAFWTKTRIQNNDIVSDFSTTSYSLYLSNANLPTGQLYGNCITNALKCALAVMAAFSSILGRAGPLQCYITSVFGIIGFQLNRQVILNLSSDIFGTYYIFTFGGFMGLALGIILKFKQDRSQGCSTDKNAFNNASMFSSSLALFGSLIIFALLPLLAHEVDVYNSFNLFNLYNGPISVVVGMGASLIGAFCSSSFFNGNVIARDIIHAPIAGGIVVGAASMFITNPTYALVAGFTAGVVQTSIHNIIQKRYLKQKSVVSTISWSLFGVQGLIGGVFATGYKNILNSNTDGFIFSVLSLNNNPGYQLLIGVISAGIGLGFGILAGLIIYLFSGHTSDDHFADRTYWINDDGISYPQAKEKMSLRAPPKLPKQTVPKPPPQAESVPTEMSIIDFDMSFSEGQQIQNFHAYL